MEEKEERKENSLNHRDKTGYRSGEGTYFNCLLLGRREVWYIKYFSREIALVFLNAKVRPYYNEYTVLLLSILKLGFLLNIIFLSLKLMSKEFFIVVVFWQMWNRTSDFFTVLRIYVTSFFCRAKNILHRCRANSQVFIVCMPHTSQSNFERIDNTQVADWLTSLKAALEKRHFPGKIPEEKKEYMNNDCFGEDVQPLRKAPKECELTEMWVNRMCMGTTPSLFLYNWSCGNFTILLIGTIYLCLL